MTRRIPGRSEGSGPGYPPLGGYFWSKVRSIQDLGLDLYGGVHR